MVESISNAGSMSYMPRQSYSLTEDEKSTVQEIIAKYDSSSMTQDSMKAMFDEFKDAGIRPSEDVKELLNGAGFAPPEKPQGGGPGGPGGAGRPEAPQFIIDLMDQIQSGEITEEEAASYIQQLSSQGENTQGVFIDEKW